MSGLFFLFVLMSLPIFYISEHASNEFLTLNEDTSKHVVQVLRMKQGEELNLCDGNGSLLLASIIDDHKKKCTVKVISTKHEVRNTKQISIAISLLKNASRFEWFLEKATEIGVTDIIPLICERTEKHHFKFERMNNILISAMLQSQQFWLPILHEPIIFTNVVSSSTFERKLIAHCEEEQKQSLSNTSDHSSTQILIGPEGDFTKEEILLALQHGYTPVTLGNTRLRTETAGVVAAVLLT